MLITFLMLYNWRVQKFLNLCYK